MKKCDILGMGGSKRTLTPPTYFQWVKSPRPSRDLQYTTVDVRIWPLAVPSSRVNRRFHRYCKALLVVSNIA